MTRKTAPLGPSRWGTNTAWRPGWGQRPEALFALAQGEGFRFRDKPIQLPDTCPEGERTGDADNVAFTDGAVVEGTADRKSVV